MRTIAQAILDATRRLERAGLPDDARRDAWLLMALAIDRELAEARMQADKPLTPEQAARFDALLAQRGDKRVPVSRLAGQRGFWTLDMALSPDTLDPRPDSETLIEAALARLPDRSAALRILDLGTGSGCLLLALLSEFPKATGLGVDIAPGAVDTARNNARLNDLDSRAAFAESDWDTAISGQFDIIVSNPPYIESGEVDTLAPEVSRHDPRLALDGGADGLDAYRLLAPRLPRLLAPGGWAFFEIGHRQAQPVARLFEKAGLTQIETVKDLAGHDRCIVARRSDETVEKQ